MKPFTFELNGELQDIGDCSPNITLLQYLRAKVVQRVIVARARSPFWIRMQTGTRSIARSTAAWFL